MVPGELSGLAFAQVSRQIQLRDTDMNRHPDPADKATAAGAATADEAQAEYFLRLLSQICRRTNLRIDMYQRGIAVAAARGDVGYACFPAFDAHRHTRSAGS
jgi:hypothetical protein